MTYGHSAVRYSARGKTLLSWTASFLQRNFPGSMAGAALAS
jgi:hypothetical protein